MTIVQPSYRLAVVDSETDKGKLGILLSTTIRHKTGQLKVIGTYWPTHINTPEDKGLCNRTVKWMRENEVDGNPLDYYSKLLID